MGGRKEKMTTRHLVMTAAVVLGTVLSVNYVLYRVRQRPRYLRSLTVKGEQGRIRVSLRALEDLIRMAASGAQLSRVSTVRVEPDGASVAVIIEGQLKTAGNRLLVRREMEELVRQALRLYAGELLADAPVDIGLTFS